MLSENEDAESPLSGWHANLILVQRRQCALFVHNTTRFPVFVPALKKADFADLDYLFIDGFMNTLLKTGANEEIMERASDALAPLRVGKSTDRSVMGTLNTMAQSVGFLFEYENVPVSEITGYRVGAWLAETPCHAKGVKDCIWPVDAMHELVNGIDVYGGRGVPENGRC